MNQEEIKAEERVRLEQAFATAAHELRLEGLVLDPKRVPEFQAVIAGELTFDQAADLLKARFREDDS